MIGDDQWCDKQSLEIFDSLVKDTIKSIFKTRQFIKMLKERDEWNSEVGSYITEKLYDLLDDMEIEY